MEVLRHAVLAGVSTSGGILFSEEPRAGLYGVCKTKTEAAEAWGFSPSRICPLRNPLGENSFPNMRDELGSWL